MMTPVPRVAAIHDLSGFGRTSLTVVLPVLSALGVQTCPLPTAVLSTHTSGFENFRFVDLSSAMRDFLAHWRELGLKFDAVYSGFLGSAGQAETVAACIDACLAPEGFVLVDPVLGDNGVLDPTMTPEMVARMRELVGKADCITPNLTEAALLLNEPFPGNDLELPRLKEWLMRLAGMGPGTVVITSVPQPGCERQSIVAAYDRGQDRFWKVPCDYIPAFYPGTGDVFASVLTGCLLRKDSLPVAVDRAVHFVTLGIRVSFGHSEPHRDGIMLERVLQSLHMPMADSTYTLLEAIS